MRYIRSFTLQDLCLETVIEHLDFFIHHKDFIPQWHISFLLRLYSKECFTQYTSSHSKTEECLLWFLSVPNKNVFLPCITQNIVERLQIVGSTITSLTLQETMATESVLNSVLCCVPHLSYLDLSSTNCSDNTLLCIQKMCPDLVTLNIQDCVFVTDSGMSNLCGNNLALKNLNISNTGVELIGLHDIVVGMPSLQCLSYDNIAESFFEIFKSQVFCLPHKINNLTELIYEDPYSNPKDVIRTWSILCPNVEKIHILFPVSHEVLHLCSTFIHLKEFKFKARRYAMHNKHFLDPLTPLLFRANNITTLKLSYVKIPSVILIECFRNVKHLHLNDVTFTDFTEDEIISKNTNLDSLTLKDLHLDMTDVAYKFIVLLISLSKNVTQLVISKMAHFPTDLVDVILNSMTNLNFIEFSFIRTKLPSSLFKFFDIPTVQRVYIDGCIDPFSGPVHFSTDSCTLAWRIMNDIDDEDEDEDFDYEVNVYETYEDDIYDYYDEFEDDYDYLYV